MSLKFRNSQLLNSSIVISGVTFDLGSSTATPAFNLASSTGLPTTALTGTITNAQLAGSIASAKLADEANIAFLNQAETVSGVYTFSTLPIANANPSADNQLARKAYVDSVAQGLDVKGSVKVATTANITLSGTQTIDGVAVAADDRVLVKDQSTPSENGIYVCAAGAWSRSSDLNTGADAAGAFTFVEQGSTQADSGFVCTSDSGAAVVGTNALAFSQFSGAGAITAGDGLAKSGNTLSVNVDDSSIEIASDTLQVKALGITNAMLAGSIDNAKLANSTISGKALGTSLSNLSLSAELEFNTGSAYNGASARTINIATGGVTNAMLAGSIDDSKLNQITTGNKVAGSAVQLAPAGNGTGGLVHNSGLEINLDGTTLALGASGLKVNLLTNAQIDNSAGIAFSKLATLEDGKILVGNASDQAAAVAVSGDITISNTGAVTVDSVQANAVGTAGIADNAVTLPKWGVTGEFEVFPISNSTTNSIDIGNDITDAAYRTGAFVQVFVNGQRIEFKTSGSPANNSEYNVSSSGGTTTVNFGGNLENGDKVFISYYR